MQTDTTGPPRGRSGGANVAAIIASGVVALFAFALLAAGAAAFWGEAQKDERGYVSTDTERFTTGTRALTTENLDLDLDGADALVGGEAFGKVRLDVASRDGKPVFVGIARTRDVSRYLRGSAHATVTDVDHSPFRAEYSEQSGARRLPPPASKRFWDVAAHGAGTQTLTWNVEDGDWSVVVMNEDGSTGVDAGVKAGAELSFLDEAGWVLLGGGLLALAAAAALLYTGVRPGRGPGRGAPAPVAATA